MRVPATQLIQTLLLFILAFTIPAFGQAPIKAALVINMTPELFLGELHEAMPPVDEADEDADQPADREPYKLVNRCMHYPFRLELENFSAREGFLVRPWWEMAFPAPIELSIKWADARNRVQRRPVSFGKPGKDANFLQVMLKHEAVKTHKAYLASSAFWRFVGYPFALSNPAALTVQTALGGLNCYTFNHYVHFSDTMGSWPSFVRRQVAQDPRAHPALR